MITNTAALEKLCAIWAQEPYITVDTEFARERTYFPKLCLVQVAGSKDIAAIDPLAQGIDLSPLFALLENPKVLKIFHACKQDIEIFYKLTGKVPQPLFDTQIAAQVCGFGEQAGYEALVTKLTGHTLDKSMQFTDWARRPLSDRQLSYALDDVIHLREVYEKLLAQKQAAGRTGWIAEEMQALADPSCYVVDPDEIWKKLRFKSRAPKYLAILKALARWRELEAQRIDIPRGRVLKDEAIMEIAAIVPDSTKRIMESRGAQGLGEARARQVLQVIEEVKAQSPETYPRMPRSKDIPKSAEMSVELLKLLLKVQCSEAGVAPRLVAAASDLEQFAGGEENVPFLHGWRYELFGHHAKALLAGKTSFAVDPETRKLVVQGEA